MSLSSGLVLWREDAGRWSGGAGPVLAAAAAIGLCSCVADDVDIGGGQGWPLEAMLNNLTATALGGEFLHPMFPHLE